MIHSRAALEGMKMGELREIGAPLGANDTNKAELIEEILRKQEKTEATDTGNLIRDLQISQGDVMRTYELRDRILAALQRLKGMEG